MNDAQMQPAKSSRGLSGQDRSYRDPDQIPNHALAGLQALQGKVPVAEDVSPARDEEAASGAEDHTGTERVIAEPGEHHELPAETSPQPGDTVSAVVAASVVEEVPATKVVDVVVARDDDRRSVFSNAAREHVASRQRAQFTVAPLAPLEVDQRPRKPKQLPKDAPWERVTLGTFQRSKNAEMLTLVREIRARGVRPVMTLEIRAPEGACTRVDFGLSIAVEKGGYEHVKLTPLDGSGLFGWLFQNGVAIFHDEVMGEKAPHPDRYLATVGVNSAVNMVASFLASIKAARQQR